MTAPTRRQRFPRGSGIGRFPGYIERLERAAILSTWADRVKAANKHGQLAPGTHTLRMEPREYTS